MSFSLCTPGAGGPAPLRCGKERKAKTVRGAGRGKIAPTTLCRFAVRGISTPDHGGAFESLLSVKIGGEAGFNPNVGLFTASFIPVFPSRSLRPRRSRPALWLPSGRAISSGLTVLLQQQFWRKEIAGKDEIPPYPPYPCIALLRVVGVGGYFNILWKF